MIKLYVLQNKITGVELKIKQLRHGQYFDIFLNQF